MSAEKKKMKLKTEIMIQKTDDTQFLVPVGAEAFHGIVRGNESAGAIVELLRKETTEEKILDAMCAAYDAQREKIAAGVRSVLNTLRKINALEK